MTATTAVCGTTPAPGVPGLGGISIPLVLSCVVPLVVALATGGWVRLVACVVAVAAGAGLVADGLLGVPGYPTTGEPGGEDFAGGLERAS